MVYVYLHLVDFYGSMYVGKYTNPMDGVGNLSHQIDIPKAFRSGELTQYKWLHDDELQYIISFSSLASCML